MEDLSHSRTCWVSARCFMFTLTDPAALCWRSQLPDGPITAPHPALPVLPHSFHSHPIFDHLLVGLEVPSLLQVQPLKPSGCVWPQIHQTTAVMRRGRSGHSTTAPLRERRLKGQQTELEWQGSLHGRVSIPHWGCLCRNRPSQV